MLIMANKLLCLLLFAGCNTVLWLGEVVNCNTTEFEDILFPLVEAVDIGVNQTVPNTECEEDLSSNFSYKEDYKNMSFATFNKLDEKWLALNLSDECLETAQKMSLLNKSDIECGGVLIDTEKYFSSFSPPQECKWLVCNDYRRHFRIVAVGMSRECDKYHFDVCDGCQFSQNGHHLEKGTRRTFCGAETLSELVSTNQVIIVEYKMDSRKALAFYQLLKHKPDCVLTSYAENGIIESPEYPDAHPNLVWCKWKINAPVAHRIIITAIDFHMPGSLMCQFAYLQIWDGMHEEYPMITVFNGDNPPPSTFMSNSNKVMISSNIEDCEQPYRSFKLAWKFQPTACNDTLRVSSGVITSPSYDMQNNQGLHCMWRIIVNPGNRIRLVFLEFDASTITNTCFENYVEITDIDGYDTTKATYCSSRYPRGAIYTIGNEAVVTLVMSSNGYQGKSFQLRFNAVCTRSLSGYMGAIESINYPHFLPPNLDCLWTITARNNGAVFINLTHVDIMYMFGSLQIFEPDHDATWGDFGCLIERTYQRTPATCLSSGKTVLVELKTSSPVRLPGTGFRLEWKIHGCGESIRNTHGMIQSTRYPDRYPVSEVCEWTILTESGSGVELTIHDWEIENSTNCIFDGLKVFTLPPHVSQPILNLCGTSQTPSILTTQLHKIYIEFHSDEYLSFKGFNASFKQITPLDKTRNCGEDHFGSTGFMYSPNFPKFYDTLHSCRWTITVHPNYLAALKILEMELEGHGCKYDNLTIFYDKVITGPPKKIFCGKWIPKNVISSNNVMTVSFQTDDEYVYKGFKAMFFQACGAKLDRDRGIIQNPDFLSMKNGAGNCSWTIVAPASENRVVLLFTDFYWSTTDPNCGQHYIEVLNVDRKISSLYRGCCSNVPPVVLGSANVLILRTRNAEDLVFKAFYFTLTKECVRILSTSSLSTVAMTVPNVTAEESKLACQQTLHPTAENNQTIKVQFRLYQPELHGKLCKTNFVAVHVKDFSETPTYNACQQAISPFEHSSTQFWSVYIILDGAGGSDDGMSSERNFVSNLTSLSVDNDSPIPRTLAQSAKLIFVCFLFLCQSLY